MKLAEMIELNTAEGTTWLIGYDPVAGRLIKISVATLDDAIALPIASATQLGVVKEGNNISIAEDGTISALAQQPLRNSYSISFSGSSTGSIELGLTGLILSISSTIPARFRLYTDETSLNNDASRATNGQVSPSVGLIADFDFVAEFLSCLCGKCPTPTNSTGIFYYSIQALNSGTSGTINFYYLGLEV